MDDDRFDVLTRSLRPLSDRRQALRVAAASLLASGVGLTLAAGDAKKKGKKKKKKKPQPTCTQLCPGCSNCYHAIDGSVICGGGATFLCVSAICTSHSDCVGTTHPYCLRASTLQSSGVTTQVCGDTAACSKINPC